jgi:hypothetical protein
MEWRTKRNQPWVSDDVYKYDEIRLLSRFKVFLFTKRNNPWIFHYSRFTWFYLHWLSILLKLTDGWTDADGRQTPSDGKSSPGLWPGELKSDGVKLVWLAQISLLVKWSGHAIASLVWVKWQSSHITWLIFCLTDQCVLWFCGTY